MRVWLGVLFLAHAGLKLFVFTPAGTAAFFERVGVPGLLAWPTIALEIAVAVALILGLWTRAAALLGTLSLFGALATVHGKAGFFFTNPGGGWEYIALWIVALLAVALLGDGALALRPWQPARRVAAA
nr:DoxX family protein [Roseomonas acroporae]